MLMLWIGLAGIALAFYISLMATPLAARVAHRVGLLDVPKLHKTHARPTPLLGGSAIFAAILGPSLLALAIARVWAAGGIPDWLPEGIAVHVHGAAERAPMALWILAGAFVLHVVGIVDDKAVLGPWAKLVAQAVVCTFVVVYLDIRILTVAGPAISAVLTIIWIVAITNAFNFLDNMDGLAAGVAAICAAALLGAAATMGQLFVSGWLCLLLGSLLGFLVYNFKPAKIFMGDAGSLVIGYMMAVLSCLTTYVPAGQQVHLYSVFVPIVVLAVPIYDTVSVIYLRLKDGRNPMVGDRRHFSHRLVRRGMTIRQAVLTIYLCTAATAVAASLLPRVDSVGAVLVLAQTVAILGIIGLLEKGAGQ